MPLQPPGQCRQICCPCNLPQIKIWTEKRQGLVRVWVEDNGIGIDPAQQNRIWGIFEQIDANKAYDGTGIRIIVKKAVERMGGRAGVESQS